MHSLKLQNEKTIFFIHYIRCWWRIFLTEWLCWSLSHYLQLPDLRYYLCHPKIIIFSISTKCIHGNTLWHETHISKCKHWVILLSVDVYHTMMDLSILYSICKSNFSITLKKILTETFHSQTHNFQTSNTKNTGPGPM